MATELPVTEGNRSGVPGSGVLEFAVFSISVKAALKWEQAERDLDIVELWSGVGSIKGAGVERGFSCAAADLLDTPPCDLTTLDGFRTALVLVLRLRVGGLLTMAPPCGSFCWLCMSKCKRSAENGFRGSEHLPAVHRGNLMADVAAFFFFVGLERNIEILMENPPRSTLRHYEQCSSKFNGSYGQVFVANTFRCSFATPGQDAVPAVKKQYKFLCNKPWVLKIERACTCEAHEKMINRNGDAITGRFDVLRDSGAYPVELGRAIVALGADLPPLSDQPSSSGVPRVPESRHKRRRTARATRKSTSPRRRTCWTAAASSSDSDVQAASHPRQAWPCSDSE